MCLCAILWARLDRIVFGASRHDAAAVGFDDAMFYEEFGRASTDRTIRSEQALREEALGALRAWQAKADRREY
jgi:tRNA(Arg) A34 adenosine deaminase TadA